MNLPASLTIQKFLAAGTFVVPKFQSGIWIWGYGGGGGGGGGATSGSPSGGGGAGAIPTWAFMDVLPNDNLAIVVGAGGTSGATGTAGVTGGNGGNTTITNSRTGITLTFYGGLGGSGGNLTPYVSVSQGGPNIRNGVLYAAGGNGTSGAANGDSSPYALGGAHGADSGFVGGGGGGAGFGAGAAGGAGTSAHNGATATDNSGAGGGGGVSTGVGGVGGSGGVIIGWIE